MILLAILFQRDAGICLFISRSDGGLVLLPEERTGRNRFLEPLPPAHVAPTKSPPQKDASEAHNEMH